MSNSVPAAGGQRSVPRASIVIVTKNRKEELFRALQSCMAQSVPLEILVIDDGSTDGTAEMVRTEFPQVRFHRSEQSQGYIVHRNLGARMATAAVVISLDDDAAFSSPGAVEQALADLNHHLVGAVAIPFVDQNPPFGRSVSPPHEGVYAIPAFIGLGYAVRRNLFLRLGGYREFFFHQAEESDFSQRLLRGGYIVRAGRGEPIHHFASPKREHSRMYIYGARNNLLCAWYYTPARWLLLHLAGVVFNQLREGIRKRHPLWVTRGLLRGVAAIWHERAERSPLSLDVYRLSRRLTRRGIMRLEEVQPLLPPQVQVNC